MSNLRLSVGEAGPARHPGDRIDIVSSWQLDAADDSVELNLLWHTRGKGTEEVEVVQRVELAAGTPGGHGERTTSLSIPEGPYSFSGRLISLAWALELVAMPSNTVERVDLVIGPEAREVDIRALRTL